MSRTAEKRVDTATLSDREFKAGVRQMWAMGDYGRFAEEFVWGLGPIVVEAARIGPGMRVLDVACGTGNVAIRAAQRGAQVVASDLAPEHFARGQELAGEAGVEIEWREADAESLPFDDEEFDVVTSAVGAIFAPRHYRVASELVRVCKPGGTIAMANFTPEGILGDFFAVFAPYMPAPREGDLPPVLWGSEDHVRELLGNRVSSLEMTRRTYSERAATPRAYCDFCKETFGPVVAIYQALADRPEAMAALDQAFEEFVVSHNKGPAGGPVELVYEYLLVVAQKAGG